MLEASDLRLESRGRCSIAQASAAPNSVIGNVHRLGCCGRSHSPNGQAHGVACQIEHAFQVAKPTASVEGFLSATPAAITDAVVDEFAQAVVRARSHSSASEYTRRSLMALLCNRLDRLHGADGREGVQSATAFDHWQLQEIGAAFVGLDSRAVSLAALSLRCRLSTCHFARKFKLTYGMPLHRYVVKLRIERARHLLRETQDPICQIALRCGFADQSSFTRRFTSVTGVSPARWRHQRIALKSPIERGHENRHREAEKSWASA